MRIISYSLFKGPDPLAEIFYVRGMYFNILMNSLVYPGWKTVVHLDEYMGDKYGEFFMRLMAKYNLQYWVMGMTDDHSHCKKMLWRMMPVFDKEVECVICRDSDALTSHREAKWVNHWADSHEGFHMLGINDNPAHSIPLMGGLCGFQCSYIRNKFRSWEEMLSKAVRPIDKHGSDQHFLMDVLYKDDPERCFVFKSDQLISDRVNPLWTSDLCTSFIGAAGVNEMETLRFFRSHLPGWGSDQDLWKQYPKIFYWHE